MCPKKKLDNATYHKRIFPIRRNGFNGDIDFDNDQYGVLGLYLREQYVSLDVRHVIGMARIGMYAHLDFFAVHVLHDEAAFETDFAELADVRAEDAIEAEKYEVLVIVAIAFRVDFDRPRQRFVAFDQIDEILQVFLIAVAEIFHRPILNNAFHFDFRFGCAALNADGILVLGRTSGVRVHRAK